MKSFKFVKSPKDVNLMYITQRIVNLQSTKYPEVFIEISNLERWAYNKWKSKEKLNDEELMHLNFVIGKLDSKINKFLEYKNKSREK